MKTSEQLNAEAAMLVASHYVTSRAVEVMQPAFEQVGYFRLHLTARENTVKPSAAGAGFEFDDASDVFIFWNRSTVPERLEVLSGTSQEELRRRLYERLLSGPVLAR